MSYYVYFIQVADDGPIKIGVAWNVPKRLRALQSANPDELCLIDTVRCASKKAAQTLEQKLHQQFRDFRIRGEWFEAVGEVRAAIHDPEGACTKTRRDEMHNLPNTSEWDDPDAPPWADDVDRANLATLPAPRRRRIVATAARQYGAASSR